MAPFDREYFKGQRKKHEKERRKNIKKENGKKTQKLSIRQTQRKQNLAHKKPNKMGHTQGKGSVASEPSTWTQTPTPSRRTGMRTRFQTGNIQKKKQFSNYQQ